ncbi:hypothetical protein GE09DRAFT_1205878 [Coniochaeta sp. 2T2.1]|nr:hypothetical protein GE09DRAFT_1205878 [Coniochaeta sp. 2T2.1]
MAVLLSAAENNYSSTSSMRRLQPKSNTRQQSADSCVSTSANNRFSVASDNPEAAHLGCLPADERIYLAQYNDIGLSNQSEDLDEAPSHLMGDSYASKPHEHETSAAAFWPDLSTLLDRAVDDISLKPLPLRHVDYLSYNWREEEIWESWRLIVSTRYEYSNAARLENASWRTWMNSKNRLKTVSPETINWLKDHDVTWLYGPLQSGSSNTPSNATHSSSAGLSKSNSFVNKKSILRKRSMSEIMLQRSLSTSSLIKQAAAAVQAQQNHAIVRVGWQSRPVPASTDYMTFPFSSRRISRQEEANVLSLSGVETPSSDAKHIHFNEQVVQCIAIEVQGGDDYDELEKGPFVFHRDSDDGAILMKRTSSKKRSNPKQSTSGTGGMESKTIAMLPSTTLRYPRVTLEPAETVTEYSTSYASQATFQPSSQETLRHSKPSRDVSLAADDDEHEEHEDQDEDDGPTPGWCSKSKVGEGSSSGGLELSTPFSSPSAQWTGMCRTESGIHMPYQEGREEPRSISEGVFRRVTDSVNKARDVAHVIWNVGWRQ